MCCMLVDASLETILLWVGSLDGFEFEFGSGMVLLARNDVIIYMPLVNLQCLMM